MLAPPSTLLSVSDSSDVGAARRAITRICADATADGTACGNASIIASELSTNLCRHATSGQLLISLVPSSDGMALEILALDKGPGILNVAQAMEDGFSTAGTPGNGLGAVRRLADDFDIYSVPGKTTAVFAKLSLQSVPQDGRPTSFQWSAINVPARNETVCGDAWHVEEVDNELRFFMADGLGHGPGASEAAQAAADVFVASKPQPVGRMLEIAHVRLSGTRGAAVANGRISAPTMTFAGVGNISATLIEDSQQRGLMSHNGIIGTRQIKVSELSYAWNPRSLLILHSDGLNGRWRMSDWPGLAARHPAIIAGVLYGDHVRGRDDVTVLVVRQRNWEDKK